MRIGKRKHRIGEGGKGEGKCIGNRKVLRSVQIHLGGEFLWWMLLGEKRRTFL